MKLNPSLLIYLLAGFTQILDSHAHEQPSLLNLNTAITVDFDTYSFDVSSKSNLLWQHLTGFYNSTGRAYSAYASFFSANFFAFYPPDATGCVKLVKTTSSSVAFGCEYATNGAFFNTSTNPVSYCVGNLISDGHIWQLPTDGSGNNRANFGVTQDNKVIVGFIDANVIAENKFSQLVTGWGWLVRHGVSNVNASQDLSFSNPTGFVYEKAPRTTVGFYKNGSMILLEIDGEEDIYAGPDLFESAELLVSLGVESAINIDGGGSSVSVFEGSFIDEPTCKDTPAICERSVASITCVKKNPL